MILLIINRHREGGKLGETALGPSPLGKVASLPCSVMGSEGQEAANDDYSR